MATAGFCSVSVYDPATNDDRRPGTASSILQMWRELEDEHSVSHSSSWRDRPHHHRTGRISRMNSSDSNYSGSSLESREWSPTPEGSENGQDDASDLGETERERVRQIFREWKSTCSRERTSTSRSRNNDGRREWLGEMEQERVRVIREWVQMTTQQREEPAGRIEQVLDGLVIDINSNTRRSIQRLCGRQALIDMLKKTEKERKMEIESLLEHRAVSQFPHRLRIQSVLRGRFLRNERVDGRTCREVGPLNVHRRFATAPENCPGGQASCCSNGENDDTIPEETMEEAEFDFFVTDRDEANPLQEGEDDYQNINTSDDLEEGNYESGSRWNSEVSRRVNSFHLPDGENLRSSELRELSNRRSVSSLLRSGFRRSLEEVLQAHIQRERSVEEEEEEENPSSETEWDIIGDLRADMARLHERMNRLQRMVEACMEMQLKLQESISLRASTPSSESL